MWEMAVLILAGLAGGFINVMAGGGSVITVPVMIFLELLKPEPARRPLICCPFS